MKQKRIFRTALALFLLLALCIPASAGGFTGKLIAITFDDGPGAYTAMLLDGKSHAKPRKPQHALQQQNRQRDQPDAGAHHGSRRR